MTNWPDVSTYQPNQLARLDLEVERVESEKLRVKHPTGFVTYYYYTMIGLSSHPLWFVLFKVTTLVSRFGILRVVVFHNIKFV